MMNSTYRRINYSIRPSKVIERKMICDIFKEFHVFNDLSKYKYIGFGSIYFKDFILFHQVLNINEMVSIEKEEKYKERFEFNIPFNCIDLKIGNSNDILPEIISKENYFIWLDYDSTLTSEVLNDLNTICTRILSGGFLIITVNCAQMRKEGMNNNDLKKYRKEMLDKNVGEENVPINLKPIDLIGENISQTYRRIIITQLKKTIDNRNAAEKQKIYYEQLLFFGSIKKSVGE